jgi:hypothetical protein
VICFNYKGKGVVKMKEVKEHLIEGLVLVVVVVVVVMLLKSIRSGQQDLFNKCIDRGYTVEYCLKKGGF